MIQTLDINTTVFTCHESNGDAVHIQAGDGIVWRIGADAGGDFVTDASTWLDGEWEPTVRTGQTPTTTDGLTAVATWNAPDGLRLLVERERLSDAAAQYISEHRHA